MCVLCPYLKTSSFVSPVRGVSNSPLTNDKTCLRSWEPISARSNRRSKSTFLLPTLLTKSIITHSDYLTSPSVPPNVEFFVDDLEAEWTFVRPFDFIYARMLSGSIKDWPKLLSQAFQ